ncbi:Hsp33 family molecular chaperone HslO [Spiroplasma taiwanense]|uniref:Heat shock protein 33 n=1 Tax=Spiroplasma taiwanense CT-1 TaxID=1276220 RepID=S5LVV7_9MOLU|nr:Hsp33 family molecular chaperone HslO [Spiroplasma taiwanense]AGR40711.1 heat shock protein 33 [Spiroplasma taiwanense CT-1]
MDMEIRATSNKNNVKISIVDITEELDKIVKLQKTNPLASFALGRTIINTALISLSVKDGSKVTTNINGMGLGGSIIAEFQNNSIKGYIEKPNFEINKILNDKESESALSQVVGTQGFLQISRDNGKKQPYTSRVELISGEINLDFMYYLQQSDQINSLISSNIDFEEDGSIKKACGVIIQLLPGFTEENIDFIEEKIGSVEHLIKTLMESTNYEALIKEICEDAQVVGINQLFFKCTCSEEKVLNTLKLLEKEEINKAINDGEEIEVVCDFCKNIFIIIPEQLKKLIIC